MMARNRVIRGRRAEEPSELEALRALQRHTVGTVTELTQQLKTERELRKTTEAAFAELQKILARSVVERDMRIGGPAGTEVQYNAMRREYVVVTRFYQGYHE